MSDLEINGTITLNDTTEISFRIVEGGFRQQWGGTNREHGLTRDLIAELSDVLNQHGAVISDRQDMETREY